MAKIQSKVTMLALGALLLATPAAEAQLLKKLSQGLEKVNKTIEKVDKTLKENKPKSKEKGNDTSAATSTPEYGYAAEETATDSPGTSDEVTLNVPFITPNTLFLNAPYALLESVDEGIFWVRRGDFLSGEKYEFWKTDGTRLTEAQWEKAFAEQPAFNSGVVPMRRPSEGYKRGNICLIYSDGRVKDLNVKWDKVTNFKDGVAVAMPTLGNGEAFYIDTNGSRIYPNIKVDGTHFNIIRPLRDGLRAYYSLKEGWGYIDKNGTVKINPKYKDATDFSEGYAWVATEDGTRHLIDTMGNTVFTAPGVMPSVSDVVDGRFYVDEDPGTCYYDVQGNKLDCFESGTQFYGGYAFVTRPESFGDVNSLMIDTDMKVVSKVPWTIVDSSHVSEKLPKFTSSGFAAHNNGNIGGNSYLMLPGGKIALQGYSSNRDVVMSIVGFKPVSEDGYFVASIYIEDGAWSRLYGAAIVKTDGEVAWIISEDDGFLRDYDASYPVLRKDLESHGGKFSIKKVETGN